MKNELTSVKPKLQMVRGQKVMFDRDVAEALGETTASLNQNAQRSPKWDYLRKEEIEDQYRFQLNTEELEFWRSQSVISSDSRHLPYVYTQKGCAFFATSMNNVIACAQAVQLVEVFNAVQSRRDEMDALEKIVKSGDEMTSLTALVKLTQLLYESAAERQRTYELITSTSQRVHQLETSNNMSGNYYAVKGYASKRGISISEPLAAQIGKATTKYCNEVGYQVSKTTHHLYGSINTYPEAALETVWCKFFEE